MKTLLVLEDESSVMGLLRHMLREYSLIEAASAEQALHLLSESDRRIDLLLADVSLPSSSGVQVALHFRSELPDLPVILTSGFPASGWSERDSADLKRLGENAVVVLQKPFPKQVVLNAVFELIGTGQAAKAGTAHSSFNG